MPVDTYAKKRTAGTHLAYNVIPPPNNGIVDAEDGATLAWTYSGDLVPTTIVDLEGSSSSTSSVPSADLSLVFGNIELSGSSSAISNSSGSLTSGDTFLEGVPYVWTFNP
jgi:hypothetical protein